MLKVLFKAKKRAHNKSLFVKRDTAPDSAAQSKAPISQPASKTNRKHFRHWRMKSKPPKKIKENFLAKRACNRRNLTPLREGRLEVSIRNHHQKMSCFFSERDLMMVLKNPKVPIPNHNILLIHFLLVIGKRLKPKLSITKSMKICKSSKKVPSLSMKKTLKKSKKMINYSGARMKNNTWSNSKRKRSDFKSKWKQISWTIKNLKIWAFYLAFQKKRFKKSKRNRENSYKRSKISKCYLETHHLLNPQFKKFKSSLLKLLMSRRK